MSAAMAGQDGGRAADQTAFRRPAPGDPGPALSNGLTTLAGHAMSPTVQHARIAIVGGGLSGLYAAWRLQLQGAHDTVLLEARDGPGGRILVADAAGQLVTHPARHPVVNPPAGSDRFDLGPAWLWPGVQPQLDALVDALGLQRFAQFEDGDMLVERSPHGAPVRLRGYRSEPPSMRLAGGMGTLVDALCHRLAAGSIADAELKAHCRAQLGRLFGPQALSPRAEVFKDWAADPFTATPADLEASGQHPEAPASAADDGPWQGRLTGIGSEWSRSFPGYLAGAVDAAERGVQAWRDSGGGPSEQAAG